MPLSASNNHSDMSGHAMPRPSLKSIREMRGYTIDDLAVTSGLTRQEIASVENGEDTDIRLLRRMAAALRVAVESLPEFDNALHS